MLSGKYLDLLRLPNGLLFTVVNGALNLPYSPVLDNCVMAIRSTGLRTRLMVFSDNSFSTS